MFYKESVCLFSKGKIKLKEGRFSFSKGHIFIGGLTSGFGVYIQELF